MKTGSPFETIFRARSYLPPPPPPPSVTVKTVLSDGETSVRLGSSSLTTPRSEQSLTGNPWDSASERDSGTGDSKKSSENVTESCDATLEMPASTKGAARNGGCGEARLSLSEFDATALTR